MAKVQICDLCKSISREEFKHFIEMNTLSSNRVHTYEICESCYDLSLEPETPQVITQGRSLLVQLAL
jgi:hypothetical protein